MAMVKIAMLGRMDIAQADMQKWRTQQLKKELTILRQNYSETVEDKKIEDQIKFTETILEVNETVRANHMNNHNTRFIKVG